VKISYLDRGPQRHYVADKISAVYTFYSLIRQLRCIPSVRTP